MSVTVSSYKNIVGGEWVDSASGETMEVLNPATGETIAEVPRGTAEDAGRAVEAAKQALPEWVETTPGERAEALLKLADLLDEHSEELAELESQNVGKPLPAARDEMPVSSDNIRFFAGAARLLEGKASGEYMRGYTSMLRREPLGVVGGITPWNYPLMMAVWKFSPALAAGNTQVLKPAEQTPLTTLRFFQLATEAEILPPGVLNVITGDGVPVGEAIVKHPDVRLVSHRRGSEDLRQAARGARPGGRVDHGRRSGRERGARHGAGDLQGSAGARLRLPRAHEGRHRPHRRRVERFASDLRQTDSDHGRRPGGRDRPARGLRAGRHRAAFRRRRSGDRVGQRCRLRPCRLRLDPRHRPGAERRPQAPVWDGLDQRPHPAGQRDAARGLQAVGLWQGPERLFARGLHEHQARNGQDRLAGSRPGFRDRHPRVPVPPGAPNLCLLQVGEDLARGADALRCAALHEALKVLRAMLAGEVDVSLPFLFVAAEAGVLAGLPIRIGAEEVRVGERCRQHRFSVL